MFYTAANSGYNGRGLNQMITGQILAAGSLGGELATIDATSQELPKPLSEPLVLLMGNSIVFYVLVIPLIVLLVWRWNKAKFDR